MSFQLNRQQKSIQKAASEFARGEFDGAAALEMDRVGGFPDHLYKNAMELGFIGIHLPERYGGGAMGLLEQVVVAEAFCRRDSTLGTAIILPVAGLGCLARFGKGARGEELLEAILEGRCRTGIVNACLYTEEPLCAMPTESTEEWVGKGQVANVLNTEPSGVVLAVLQEGTETAAGEVLAIIDTRREGVTLDVDDTAYGLRLTPRGRLILDDVHIPAEDVPGGAAGCGARSTLLRAELRMVLAALALGVAQGALDRAVVHVKERKQFGRAIGCFQVLRHKMAAMEAQIQSARLLTYSAAAAFNQRKPDAAAIARAVLAATGAGVFACGEAIQLMGGYGFTVEYGVERRYRDAKTLQLFAGYRSDLKDEIAAAVVGRMR